MKCPITIAVVFIACGCPSFPAISAETPGNRLLRFEQDGKFGFKDGTGKVVITPIYDDVGDFACGLCPVNQGAVLRFNVHPAKRDGGKWGYINTRGRIVVPLALDWAIEFTEGLAHVCDNQGRRFIDIQGNTVFSLGDVSAGRFSGGLAPVYVDRSSRKQDWQTRYIDKKGKTVFTVDGYAEEYHEGMAVLSVRHQTDAENAQYGFIDCSGKIVIAPQFAEAFDFHEGLAGVRTKKTAKWWRMGDTWGYVDKTGKFILEPMYNEVHPFRNGVARVHVGGTLHEYDWHSPPVWKGGEWQLIDRKGSILKRSNEWVEYKDVANKRDSGDGK